MGKFAEGFRDGDGKDPRFDKDGSKKVRNRKALQLCSQVSQAVHIALNSLNDDRLRSLQVKSVVPNPDSAHLLVTFSGDGDIEAVMGASGRLRQAVAAAINRRKTPELRFVLEKIKPLFPLPGEETTLGDRLILNALRRKCEALATYEANPTKETQEEFLKAVAHMNHIKENV